MAFCIFILLSEISGLSSLVEFFGGTTIAVGLFVTAGLMLLNYLRSLKVAAVGAAVGMKALNLAMRAHPLLLFTGIATAILGMIGSLKAFGKEVDKTAANHAKLESVQKSLAEKAAQFKAQQQALERTVTSIVEAWDSYKDPVIRLPFAAEARSALMWMNKLQSEMSHINEDVAVYQDYIRDLKKRRIGMFGDPEEMERIDKQIRGFEKGIRRYRNTAVAAGVSVGQAFQKSMKQLAKFKPEDIGSSFVAAVISKKDKSEIEALAMLEKDIISRATAVEASLLNAKKAYDATMRTSSNVKERNAAIRLYEDTVRKLLPQYIAIEEAANKITVSTKQIMGRTKDYANALLRVRKQLAKMKEEYAVLVTDDPFLEMHLNTKRRVQEISLEYDKYNKKLIDLNAQIAKRPDAAITKELRKQHRQLTSITGVLREQEVTVRKIGAEKANILRKEIADGVHKIRVETELFNIEQKIQNLKRAGASALAIYREEISLSNQKVDIKVRELELEKQLAIAKFDGAKVVELTAKMAAEKAKKVEAPEQKQVEMEMVATAGVIPEDIFSQRQALLDAEYVQYADFVNDKAELDAWYVFKKQELQQEEKANSEKLRQAELSGAANIAGSLGSLLETMNANREKKSRKMFEVMKVANVAEATINTYAAATKALKDTPGPPWVGMAAAAAIVTAGLANVSNIASTSFGGGGGGGAAAGAAPSEYKYYSYEQSGYAGTGWRPGEGQGGYNEYADVGKRTDTTTSGGVTQKITINAMDAKSVKQLVDDNPDVFLDPVRQDIKDGGETREVIRNYA